MLDLLVFLAKEQGTAKGKAIFISKKELALKANLSLNTVKTSLARLKTRGLVQTLERHFSCKAGGASYVVTKSAFKLLDSADLEKSTRASEAELNPGPEATLVSSRNQKNYDNNYNVESEKQLYNSLVRKLNLGEHKIGANHLADWHRYSGLSIEKFSESVEHPVFYATGEQSVGIRDTLVWLASTLKKGYFHEPADFVSAEERLERVRLKRRNEKTLTLKK